MSALSILNKNMKSLTHHISIIVKGAKITLINFKWIWKYIKFIFFVFNQQMVILISL